jgi:hypothetical protein
VRARVGEVAIAALLLAACQRSRQLDFPSHPGARSMLLAMKPRTGTTAVVRAFDLDGVAVWIDADDDPPPDLVALFFDTPLAAQDIPAGAFPSDPYGRPLGTLGQPALASLDLSAATPHWSSPAALDSDLMGFGVPSACLLLGQCFAGPSVSGAACVPCNSAPPAAPAPPAPPDFSDAPASWPRTATSGASIALPWPLLSGSGEPPSCDASSRLSLPPGSGPCTPIGSPCPPSGTFPSGFLPPGDLRPVLRVDPAAPPCPNGPPDGSPSCPFPRIADALSWLGTHGPTTAAIVLLAETYAEPPLQIDRQLLIQGACTSGTVVQAEVTVAGSGRAQLAELSLLGELDAKPRSSLSLASVVIRAQTSSIAIQAVHAALAADDLLVTGPGSGIVTRDTELSLSRAEVRRTAPAGIDAASSAGHTSTATLADVFLLGAPLLLGGKAGELRASLSRVAIHAAPTPAALWLEPGARAEIADLAISGTLAGVEALVVNGAQVRARRLVSVRAGGDQNTAAHVLFDPRVNAIGDLDLADAYLSGGDGGGLYVDGGRLTARRVFARGPSAALLYGAIDAADLDLASRPRPNYCGTMIVTAASSATIARVRVRGPQAAFNCLTKATSAATHVVDLDLASSDSHCSSLGLDNGCVVDVERGSLAGGSGAVVKFGAQFTGRELVLRAASTDGLACLGGSTVDLSRFEIAGNGGAGVRLGDANLMLAEGVISSNPVAFAVEDGSAPALVWFENREQVVLDGNGCPDVRCAAYPPIVRSAP